MTEPPTLTPLWRNRDFVLLQTGRLLSHGGSEMTSVAYPLLALALTGSAAKAGIVAFARMLPAAFVSLPAGVAADRWNRKRIMIGTDVVRALAVAALAAAILLDRLAFWQVPAVAFVEGAASTAFFAAQAGALRSVVPAPQLPGAAGATQARVAAVTLAGPPLGGALYGLGRAIPFLADAVSYAFSIVSLVAMRTPFQEERDRETAPLRAQLSEGFRFLWQRPFLRTTALLWGIGNVTGPALLLVLVVAGRRQGLSGGAIGALLAVFGSCLLLGSLASPLFRRALSVRTILLLEFWAWLGTALFVVWPDVYVLLASMLPVAVAIPVSDSVLDGYRLAITPDRLVGRVESARRTISLLVAPLGPLAAGFLLEAVSARETIAVFTAASVALAVTGTLSPAIRNAPSLAEPVPDG